MTDQPDNPLRETLADSISSNEVILFMKGTPEQPMCGFSARVCAALTATETQFAAVDVLADPRIRQELSSLSNWPTIPQLFVRGELVGGADIVGQMYQSGELAAVLGAPATSTAEPLPESATPGSAPPLQIENRLG